MDRAPSLPVGSSREAAGAQRAGPSSPAPQLSEISSSSPAGLFRNEKVGSVLSATVSARLPDGRYALTLAQGSFEARSSTVLIAGQLVRLRLERASDGTPLLRILRDDTAGNPSAAKSAATNPLGLSPLARLGLPDTPLFNSILSFARFFHLKLDATALKSIKHRAFQDHEEREGRALLLSIARSKNMAVEDAELDALETVLENGEDGRDGASGGWQGAQTEADGHGEHGRRNPSGLLGRFNAAQDAEGRRWLLFPVHVDGESPLCGHCRILLVPDAEGKPTLPDRMAVELVGNRHRWYVYMKMSPSDGFELDAYVDPPLHAGARVDRALLDGSGIPFRSVRIHPGLPEDRFADCRDDGPVHVRVDA